MKFILRDPILLFLLLFSVISVLMLKSMYETGVFQQSIYFLIGITAYWIVSHTSFAFWKRVSFFLYVFFIMLLSMTLVFGKTTKGSTRWIQVGSVQAQPSQFMIPFLGLFLAVFSAEHTLRRKKHVVQFLTYSVIPIGLTFIQPDLGTATILFMVSAGVFLCSRVSVSTILIVLLIIFVGALIGWKSILHDYQRQRLRTYLSSEEKSLSTGYNEEQAKIAVGSGKITGRGFGHGVQSSLRFLPEHQTDFFFAAFAEEFGFIGSVLLIFLYFFFFSMLFTLSTQPQSLVAELYRYALLAALLWQTIINLGMNTGILPITGIPLPLLSYGGSSILSLCIGLGLFRTAFSQRTEAFVEFKGFV